MTFHLTCDHIIWLVNDSSVSVAERPVTFWEIAAYSIDHVFSLYFDY